MNKVIHYTLLCFLFLTYKVGFSQCGPTTPSFTANLACCPTGTWTSPTVQRNDTCCGSTNPDKCIKFTIILAPNAVGINFNIASGAIPPGALFYQIGCGPPIAVGQPICLSGAGPHILTFCKPGNNNNTYEITSIPAPVIPDSILVRNGCTATLAVTGFSVPTITWNSINPGPSGAYNSYLSCTSGCASVVVTPTGTPPPFVDYVVGGFAASPCQANYYQDTVRVYFYNDLVATINPTLTTICFGQTNAVLTGSASGGLPAYTYSWSTGSTATSVTVGPGTYTFIVNDKTGCPPATATAVVNSFTLPITANAGPDQLVCKTSPNATLTGAVTSATSAVWSGGSGTISPSSTSYTITYTPTAAEVLAGFVQLYFTTTGNYGCPPDQDTVRISFQNVAITSPGPSSTVCANNNAVNLTGSVTGFTNTGVWSSSGTGTFSSTTNLNTTYTPSAADNAAGSVTITLTSTNNGACPPATSSVVINITPSPTVNAGTGQTICSSGTVTLNGTVIGGATTGNWTTSGSGSFNPSSSTLNGSYIPSASDIAAGTVTLTLTSTNNGNCFAVSDTIIIGIRKLAVVNAGPNLGLCSSAGTISLTGNVSGGTTTGIWAASGTGGFNPNNTSMNTAYNITAGDISTGFVTFTLTATNNSPCPAVTDTVKVRITQIATVDAGPTQTVCSNGFPSLNGTITGGTTTGNWTTSGSGTFTPGPSVLTASYLASASDIAAGTVTLTLTSTNNGYCPAVSDNVVITIKGMAIVNAGPNLALCSNSGSISLTGNVSGGTTTGIWAASGIGSYNPNNTTLNTAYNTTAADISAGSVTFTLTSTNNGPCPAVTDTVKVSITTLASVNAGPNQNICSNTSSINLSGSVTGVSGTGIWTGSGSGSYNPNNTTLNTAYNITPADISAGFATFTLTSLNNGPCPAVTDSVRINIKTLASVNAGPNLALCSNSGSISLTGNVSGGTSTGIWSASGIGGFNPNNTTLNTSYNITSADISAGSVTFTLSSTNNGACPVVTDTVKISITTLAVVNAGPNQFICSNSPTINLNGSIVGASGTGVWSSNGTGSYNPGNTTLNAAYNVSAGDISAGSVTFTLTSLNNGPCPAVTDSVKVNIGSLATVNAGPNLSLCSTAGTISLSGTINGVTTTGFWTGSGNGGYNPNNTNLITTYNISPADIIAGSVTFTLASTNNGPCPAVTDTVKMLITTLANVNSGPNQTICSNTGAINLNGMVSGVSGNGMWTSSGSGTYSPNNTTLNASYSITPTDITNGFVTFTLTSLNNGACAAVTDSVRINITTIASVNAGPSKLICSSTGTISLNGTISGSTGSGVWTTNGTGPFVPSSTSLNNTYFITVSDVAAGTVTFSLSSTNNGVCPAVIDTMLLFIDQVATVNAGPNQALCSNTNTISLSGTVGGGSSTGIWNASGTGSFMPNNTSLSTTYSITPTDINNGSVTFTLSSTNNAACPSIRDSVKITIRKLAIVNAGPDQSICSTTTSASFSGSVSVGSTTGIWTTSGTGFFTPNNTSLNTNYNTSSQDVSSGSVLLILTSTNNGVCPAVIDTAKLNIIIKPVLNINTDTTICAYGNIFTASVQIAGGSGNVIWTSNGTGYFSPQDFYNPVNYNFSTADISNGFVILKVTSVNNGACGNSSAQIFVTIRPVPTANFSASTYTAYIPNDPISSTNQSTNASTYYWYFGDGGFSNATNPIHNYPTVGFYTVGLIAINQYGCKDTTEQVITAISDVQFPNVFTPNTGGSNGGTYNVNDFSNDVFFPYTAGVTEYNLMIFNRWGELIFQSRDIMTGWDGYFNGKLCQQDAYVWKAEIKFFDGRKYDKTGSVTLLR
jgi:gliding motility-associated-like protein